MVSCNQFSKQCLLGNLIYFSLLISSIVGIIVIAVKLNKLKYKITKYKITKLGGAEFIEKREKIGSESFDVITIHDFSKIIDGI